MQIGIIGAAEMGSVLAKKLVDIGHEVTIANSRGPQTLKKIEEETGANAVSIDLVTKNKDLIIIAIPLKNVVDLPKVIFENLPKGVVVIETCNYYPTLRDGIIPMLQESGIDSLWVQNQLGVEITKVFNSILAISLKDKATNKGDENRIAIPVAGDNEHSKKVVFDLLAQMGFDTFNVGSILQSWKQQPGSSIYCRDLMLGELEKKVNNMPDDWSIMRQTILQKRSSDEMLMRENYSTYLENLKNE